MHVQLGLERQLETAEQELDSALERDPMFMPLLEQRLTVAAKRGGPELAAWNARIERVRALEKN